jgi:hypothetical protein
MTSLMWANLVALLVLLAAAGWAAKACYNAGYWSAYSEWQSAIARANTKHEEEQTKLKSRLHDIDAELVRVLASQEKLQGERDAAVTDAQSKIPLSDACMQCRVPAGRVNGGLR